MKNLILGQYFKTILEIKCKEENTTTEHKIWTWHKEFTTRATWKHKATENLKKVAFNSLSFSSVPWNL